jgi:hypothetical protein
MKVKKWQLRDSKIVSFLNLSKFIKNITSIINNSINWRTIRKIHYNSIGRNSHLVYCEKKV